MTEVAEPSSDHAKSKVHRSESIDDVLSSRVSWPACLNDEVNRSAGISPEKIFGGMMEMVGCADNQGQSISIDMLSCRLAKPECQSAKMEGKLLFIGCPDPMPAL